VIVLWSSIVPHLNDAHVEAGLLGQLLADVTRRFRCRRERRFQRVQLFRFDGRARTSSLGPGAAQRHGRVWDRAPRRDISTTASFVFRRRARVVFVARAVTFVVVVDGGGRGGGGGTGWGGGASVKVDVCGRPPMVYVWRHWVTLSDLTAGGLQQRVVRRPGRPIVCRHLPPLGDRRRRRWLILVRRGACDVRVVVVADVIHSTTPGRWWDYCTTHAVLVLCRRWLVYNQQLCLHRHTTPTRIQNLKQIK